MVATGEEAGLLSSDLLKHKPQGGGKNAYI
jgi:hypothetical protein